MTPNIVELSRRLIEVVSRENRALQETDYRHVEVGLPEKQTCIQAMLEWWKDTQRRPRARSDEDASLIHNLAQLEGLLAENRLLLNHALEVQSRVMGLIAEAAREFAEVPAGYGARGAYASDPGTHAFAVCHRA